MNWRAPLAGKPQTLVLSGEALCTLDRNTIARLMAWLRTVADDIRVLAYVREARGWATSSFQQRMKAGRDIKELESELPTPAIRDKLERWIAVCGKEALSVYSFDAARNHPNGICGHFLAQIGLPELADRVGNLHMNQSLPAQALQRISELSQQYGRRLTRQERAEIVSAMTEAPQAFRLPDALLCEIERAAQPDFDWLAAEFGLRI